MRRTLVIFACLGAVLTAAGCGSDADAASAPEAKTAYPPMSSATS